MNSVTGEEERLEVVLPLVKKYNCAVVAISNDETGISEDPQCALLDREEDRRARRRSRHSARGYRGRSAGDAGRSDQRCRPPAHPLLRRLREELKVNTTCGASNFSFGLPNRRGLASSFLPMMIGAGMTSAIMNPLHAEDIQAIAGATW